MEQFQSLVGLMPWTWIFTICNLLLLTAGVKHFLFKPVQAILAKRQEEIQTQYTEAEQAEESAKAMQVEYEARLANAKAEATDIVKTATTR
ncbi:MAG: ATP synthase F0 subunit B, partial [Ruthenibacterium sp.]